MRSVLIDENGFFAGDILDSEPYDGKPGTAPAWTKNLFISPRWNGAAWEEGATVEAIERKTIEAAAREKRTWRNAELRRADIEIAKGEDTGANVSAWRTYRVDLRNMPQQGDDARAWVRPVAPV